MLAGIDEAGRGPLAGPVVAAAVVLDEANPIEGLGDSKKLSLARREALFVEIQGKAIAYGIGMAEPEEIDERNILQATLLAMRRAYDALNIAVDEVWVDGNQDPGIPALTFTLVGGDGKLPAIGAASILAKVTRDRLMVTFAKTYPQYGFEQHKGYPTPHHLQQLQLHGPCVIHRRSFAPVNNAKLGLIEEKV